MENLVVDFFVDCIQDGEWCIEVFSCLVFLYNLVVLVKSVVDFGQEVVFYKVVGIQYQCNIIVIVDGCYSVVEGFGFGVFFKGDFYQLYGKFVEGRKCLWLEGVSDDYYIVLFSGVVLLQGIFCYIYNDCIFFVVGDEYGDFLCSGFCCKFRVIGQEVGQGKEENVSGCKVKVNEECLFQS